MEQIVNSNTVDKVADKVTSAIGVLAEKLGMASEHFYPVIVKQQVIEGYLYLIPHFIGISIVIAVWVVIIRDMRKPSNRQDIDDGIHFWFLILSAAIGAIVLYNATQDISRVINPEYFAMHEIVEIAESLK